jgi:predicted ATPase/DNA-binding SARP family transcriptional activator
MARLSISFLGPFRATLDGQVLSGFASHKVRALLAYLAVETDRPHARDSLAALLWPNYPNRSALNTLRSVLANLRQVIGDGSAAPPFLIITRDTIQFNPAADYELDVDIFQAATAGAINRADTLLTVYQGDFLEGFSLPDNEVFEEWLQVRREHLRRQMLQALDRLTVGALEEADYGAAAAHARRQLEMDNLHESAHRQLMSALALDGQRAEALMQYETCVHLLRDELGVEPLAETRLLAKRIAGEEEGAVAPAGLGSRPIRHNLPAPLTSFIGREREIEEVQRLLATSRLVTLTGAGGCGKSRLSLEVAGSLLEDYADGVWWVELAPLENPELVGQTVAYALGLRDQSDRPIQGVLNDYLASRDTLLMLDNCEHLIEASASLAEALLQACPRLSMLATSREALSVSGETLYIVPPLEIPDPQRPLFLAKLSSVASVRLFVERAASIWSGFELTDQNMEAVAQICQRLDGIPLAIELAAARVRTLSTSQLVERIDDRFQLLTSGSRTALPRHQTLRSTIDWSYKLLSPSEQHLLNRLSVFVGGFELAAAEGVCADENDRPNDIFDLLTQLVGKSLVAIDRTRGSGARFGLLETIRQYGGEKLEAAGKTSESKRRHARYYAQLALGLPHEHKTALAVNRTLDREMGNFRAALRWLWSTGDLEELAQLCAVLAEHWFTRGYLAEGQEWLDLVLDQRQVISRPIQALVLKAKGKLTYESGKYDQAQAIYQESRTIYHQLGNMESVAEILNLEGVAAMMMGRFKEAIEYHQQSQTEYRKLGLTKGIAANLNRLGYVAYCDKEFDYATKLLQESLELYTAEGDELGEALALNCLGEIARARGDYVAAQALYEHALRLYQQYSEKYSIAVIRLNLAHTLFRLGDSDTAQNLLRESLSHFYELNNIKLCALSLVGLSLVADRLGHHVKAAILVGALEITFQKPGERIVGPADLDAWEEAVTRTNEWGDKSFLASALERGRNMSFAELVAFALEN